MPCFNGGFGQRAAPTSGGGGFVFNNQPPGYTLIQDFKADGFPVAPTAYQGWEDDIGSGGTAFSLITDATAPTPVGVADNKYISTLFPSGQGFGIAPSSMLKIFTVGERFKKLFYGLWVRHESGWDNNPDPPGDKVGVKFIWFCCKNTGDQDTDSYCAFDGTTMEFTFQQQNDVTRGMGANINPSSALCQGRNAQWIKLEILLQLNSATGTPDGKLDAWIDGIHTHVYTDVAWSMSADKRWQATKWNPVYGGGGGNVPYNMHQSISHIRIMGSN